MDEQSAGFPPLIGGGCPSHPSAIDAWARGCTSLCTGPQIPRFLHPWVHWRGWPPTPIWEEVANFHYPWTHGPVDEIWAPFTSGSMDPWTEGIGDFPPECWMEKNLRTLGARNEGHRLIYKTLETLLE